jgi:predicted dehydrogenase/threonine dehydrogenase-like Zn-dependent dehydrogenase
MRQLLQDLSNGQITLQEVPCPLVTPGHVLVRTAVSLVSAGTERMLLEFGKASLLGKARQQPDRVREAWEKIRTDGLMPTLDAIRAKLDEPVALGYCNVGEVLEVGEGVPDLAPGDRVVSNGSHAEAVLVSANLCAKIPPAVSDHDAAFTVIGAIALEGLRLAAPTLGETFAVIGLGLVGQLACQLLRAHGCRVLGIDPIASRTELARKFGVETFALSAGADPVAAARAYSGGRGVDGVIIGASTASDEPIHQAAQMCRKRGRIVLVGVSGLRLSRADFYEKELSFQVSCSYGPGRYDPDYESGRHDYPLGFVRWTARRNFEAVLEMIAAGRLETAPLITHRFGFEQANLAYDALAGGSSLGIVIEYPRGAAAEEENLRRNTIAVAAPRLAPRPAQPAAAVIGAGHFAGRTLLPALRSAGVHLRTVVSMGGVSAARMAKKFGAEQSSTDPHAAIADPRVNTVVVATRHDTHAALCCEALEAGKHVFVEKPLALSEVELDQIEKAYAQAARQAGVRLMAGFNRRFSPLTQRMKSLLQGVAEPKCFIVTVNAGVVPPAHWTRDRRAGGGRIVGEACHFVDLARFLAGCRIAGFQAASVGAGGDAVSFTLRFEDGSLATVNYLDNGANSFPKERIEVFAARRTLVLDNFRRLTGYNWPGFKRMALWRQDKGHEAAVAAFAEAIRSGLPSPIAFEELAEVSRVTLRIARAATINNQSD